MKLVLIERDSAVAAELWNGGARATTSVLGYPEGRAALAAARRDGRLTSDAHARAVKDYDRLQPALDVLDVDEELARRAGDAAAEHSLRGSDAVHLVSALALGASDTTMVTWDRDLARAAARSGCAVAGAA